MQIIGLSFNKISSFKSKDFKRGSGTNINIDFSDIQKEDVPLIKDQALKVSFKFSVIYEGEKKAQKMGEVIYEGDIVINATEAEVKDVLKSWKKKELSPAFRLPLFNLILQKCSIKALILEEDLQLPHHMPLPVLRPEQKQDAEKN